MESPNIDPEVSLQRRFCNKIWNACKFVLGNLANYPDFVPRERPGLGGKESLAELWIIAKLNTAVKEINKSIEDREFSKASNTLYAFWYGELCDVFIEVYSPSYSPFRSSLDLSRERSRL